MIWNCLLLPEQCLILNGLRTNACSVELLSTGKSREGQITSKGWATSPFSGDTRLAFAGAAAADGVDDSWRLVVLAARCLYQLLLVLLIDHRGREILRKRQAAVGLASGGRWSAERREMARDPLFGEERNKTIFRSFGLLG